MFSMSIIKWGMKISIYTINEGTNSCTCTFTCTRSDKIERKKIVKQFIFVL